jgi:hypothetical protein
MMEAMYRGEIESYFLETFGEPYEDYIHRIFASPPDDAPTGPKHQMVP